MTSDQKQYDQPPEVNECYKVPYVHPKFYCALPTVEATEKELTSLDEDSVLDLDMIPTWILKRCVHALALLLHTLIIVILTFGERPTPWMVHWVVPRFKRK